MFELNPSLVIPHTMFRKVQALPYSTFKLVSWQFVLSIRDEIYWVGNSVFDYI